MSLPRLAAALLAIVVAGCGTSGQQSGNLAPGFYRHENDPTVYMIAAEAPPCVVGSMAQLTALGGLSSVHVIKVSEAIVAERAPLTQCTWPSGDYRLTSTGVTYRIEGLKGCRKRQASDGAASTAIPTIEELRGVKITGDCTT